LNRLEAWYIFYVIKLQGGLDHDIKLQGGLDHDVCGLGFSNYGNVFLPQRLLLALLTEGKA